MAAAEEVLVEVADFPEAALEGEEEAVGDRVDRTRMTRPSGTDHHGSDRHTLL